MHLTLSLFICPEISLLFQQIGALNPRFEYIPGVRSLFFPRQSLGAAGARPGLDFSLGPLGSRGQSQAPGWAETEEGERACLVSCGFLLDHLPTLGPLNPSHRLHLHFRDEDSEAAER